jgi:UDP-N-acetylmuramyl pentapeptide phosphotransferase/UDP-N-acetylglucosamine-1-phosphate transferase
MLIIPNILVIAHNFSIFDMPDTRKSHTHLIPRLGGISFVCCIFFTLLAVYVIYMQFPNETEHLIVPDITEFCWFLFAMLLLFLGGLKDDLIGMRYRYKFLIQITASVMIVCSGLYINNLHGLFGIQDISPWIGIPLTVVLLVFIINSLNFIDGTDGLSAGIGIMALSIYGTFFLLHDLWHYAVIACCMIGVLCVFFCYNVFGNVNKKRKLFMGDCGSMTLGMILGFLLLQCIHVPVKTVRPMLNVLVIGFSPLLLPILDVLRVILSRIKRRKHLFTADRCHIHHKLLNLGTNKSVTMITLIWINSGYCFLNFILLPFLGSLYIFLIDIAIWTCGNMILSYHIKKRNIQQQSLPFSNS